MKKVRVYSTRVCPFCVMAKRLLTSKGVDYEDIAVDGDPAARLELVQKTGRRTVPQIFIGDTCIGGFDDLSALDRKGELDTLLADPARG